ncbi:1,4-dihydroxy-2-naphthoate polyprenyltransferase [Subtercola boreus]|uniref:1,4-dihydroxy-2-naphthoate octaprenyltransferase n=1 Tax=Subtercola boreus TaxID=120213 RepID=A0A3E0WFZ7_9MICO|nr:1,4-dihydroxy-2-naphthoate polyprenyltransferase [Subtercola boreus]RFA23645.1 1,4-dihydroxy-2-naphthoate polyprenyltransferase [Subtercola boreus]RFA24039.1 1,4-dihydroxy-2-naphthoate polyprenyltransferase [Subtercola boreus]RFA29819.1 1,4-dihydroxy-2-naphthoate polyprenyltransferase [Subtercola boreus]
MWIAGARIRTLPLAIAPVALGAGAASLIVGGPGSLDWGLVLLSLAVALFLQIGVNYSNDYSDGVRGTDEFRVGPPRLTGSGVANPKRVLAVALAFFGLGALAGIAIVILTGHYWLLIPGALAIAAAYFYTGGKRPYGYYGLGEVFVFLFFGVVATVGTTYIASGSFNFESVWASVAAGLIACAVLMVNNIRDIEQDRVAKKRTLAVLLGNRASRIVFVVFLVLAYAVLFFFALLFPLAPLVFFTLLLALPASLIVLTAKTAPELILALKLTSLTGLLFGVGLAAAFAF